MPGVFEALVARHERRLFRIASGMLRDPGEAADAVQDSLTQAWKAMPRFREQGGDPESWLVTICLNRCRDRLRSRARGPARALPDDLPAPPRPDALGEAEVRGRILDELTRLPEREREAFLLVLVEGYDSSRAGEILACPAVTVRAALGRARRTLALRLRDLKD